MPKALETDGYLLWKRQKVNNFFIHSFVLIIFCCTTVANELNKFLTQKGEKIKNAQYEHLAEQTSYWAGTNQNQTSRIFLV
jgi:hypothetical protein